MEPTAPYASESAAQQGRGDRAPVLPLLAAYALVTLGPAVAWLVWISWDSGGSDATTVTWFVTVALASMVAGSLAGGGRRLHDACLPVVAGVATMTTLYLWWSATDLTGMFMIGIIAATPLVALLAPLLVLLGSCFPYRSER